VNALEKYEGAGIKKLGSNMAGCLRSGWMMGVVGYRAAV